MCPHKCLANLAFALLLSWSVNCTAQVPASDPNNTGNWVRNTDNSDQFNGTSLDTTKWSNNSVPVPRSPSELIRLLVTML